MNENKGSVSPVVYAALGDSTGAGVGAREGGYAARLFTRIKGERADARLINLCVSGATTGDVVRDQLDQAIKTRPTLITLGIGINDLTRGASIEQFAQNYETIVARLRAETSAPVIVTNIPDISLAPAVPAFTRDELRRRTNIFNERINQIVERHNARLVDAYQATHEVVPTHPEFFSSDGFHPSDAGYEYWARIMWPSLHAALNER
jgi:lysophospholipase L1-like esterase